MNHEVVKNGENRLINRQSSSTRNLFITPLILLFLLRLNNLPGLFLGSLVLTLIAAPLSTLIFSMTNLSKIKV
ncbi:hypothetical protein MKW98_020590 [Papaver atlanticum]|uniref:Uncharacterized protein n=1 Tax=Papaver atlanticum TaxID=357466 RepID=A0AAD4THZ2_9MAGN|nr:hypothetical protein MKW98_020590 [Papaver atlanticum]